MLAGRDAGERLARRDDAGAVRADDAGRLALGVGPELGAVLGPGRPSVMMSQLRRASRI